MRIAIALLPLLIGTLTLACKQTPDEDACDSDASCADLICDFDETPRCVDTLIGSIFVCECVPHGESAAQSIVEGILGVPIEGFFRYIENAPTGVETANSNPDIVPRVPLAFGDAEETGAIVEELTNEQLQRLKELFIDDSALSVVATKSRAKSLALQAEMPAELLEGPYLFVWQTMQAPIPEADPVQRFQYAFVADHDRQVVNNFRGQEPFEGDYFDNTDLWFALEYDPENGWNLEVTDALNGSLTSVPSAARGILSGPVQMFVIPTSEFKGSSTIAARWTTFAHEGDFGQDGGPWSGDATPVVGAALRQISLIPEP